MTVRYFYYNVIKTVHAAQDIYAGLIAAKGSD